MFGAYRYMNNLTTRARRFKDQLVITKRKHTWIMSWIYIGTFGSFIGYSAAFPLLIKTQFPAITVGWRSSGRWSARCRVRSAASSPTRSAAREVTFWNFVAMGIATMGVMYYVDIKSFAGFLTMFLILFVTTGIGNGSTFRMIPSIFREEKLRGEGLRQRGKAAARSRRPGIESAAVIGFIGAIGACGGYLIPRGFGASIAATGGPHLALEVFLASTSPASR